MADWTKDEMAHRINATNPSQLEMKLALEPGGPESLEEAARRVLNGEPVIQPNRHEGGETQ